MTVDLQALSTTIFLSVAQAVQKALEQVTKASTSVATEKKLLEATVQDDVSVLTKGITYGHRVHGSAAFGGSRN